MRIVLGTLLLVLAMMVIIAEGRSLFFDWNVKRELDFHRKQIITINGQTPGPIIQAKQGDFILVKVNSRLPEESLAINWGGIRQIGTPSCAGQTCIYRFVADQAGKYSYQSESPMQKEAGLHGLIVVLP